MTSHDVEIMDGDLVDHSAGMELEPMTAAAPVTLFRSDDPNEIVQRATDTANALAKVVRDKKLTVRIQKSDHVRVEGWTLLGTMLGVFPVCVWSRKLDDGWEARVEARTLAGLVVGAAEAMCTRAEKTWGSRDDYALRSMAQTRATSKALRQPLGFVMTLAGFDPTPAEEMPREQKGADANPEPVSKDQHALIGVLIKTLEEKRPDGAPWVDRSRAFARENFGVDSRAKLTSAQAHELIEWLKAEEIPF